MAKYGIGLILGVISGSFALIVISHFIKLIDDKNLRLIGGLFLGFLGFHAALFLTVYLWRKLLVILGLMTKNESQVHPFFTPWQERKTHNP
mgnify:CR=1 FL=1